MTRWRREGRRCGLADVATVTAVSKGWEAARQQVRMEKWGRRQSAHSNASSLSPRWSRVIPNYHCSEGKGGRVGDVQRIREEKAERSGVCLNLSQILRDGARARAEVNTHACCYTFARLWGGNSVFMKIEACRLPAHLCIHYIQPFFSAGNPPWNTDLPFLICWVLAVWGFFCPPRSHQWNLGSSKFRCRGEISHLKCGSFDVARPHLFKCKYTVNSGPLDNNQGWTRTITQPGNLIQSQAPLFNICGCNRYQVGKLSWLQCAKCALTLGVASKSHWIQWSQHKATHTKPLAETLFDTRPRSARRCTNVRSIKSNKKK